MRQAGSARTTRVAPGSLPEGALPRAARVPRSHLRLVCRCSGRVWWFGGRQPLFKACLVPGQSARSPSADATLHCIPVCARKCSFDPNYAAADEMGDDEEADDMEAEEDEE